MCQQIVTSQSRKQSWLGPGLLLYNSLLVRMTKGQSPSDLRASTQPRLLEVLPPPDPALCTRPLAQGLCGEGAQ